MSEYKPAVTDIRFVLEKVAGLRDLAALDQFSDAQPDIVGALLEEAGRFTKEVVAPLARVGDQHGTSRRPDGSVESPPGYAAAYAKFVEAGWPAAAFPAEWGGGAMPGAVGIAVHEMLTSADMAFSLLPMLSYSSVKMLMRHSSEEQQATYLEKLVSGEWAGTMALTEPQAGSDVGALTTKAVQSDDGSWRLTGTKIFITWGEHEMAENIIHIVLARTPGAPPGTKGISCFIVPKFLVNPDGSLGERNDIQCVSIEHKLGIHASPTCVLSFGDEGGAIGYLIGEAEQGMRYMFTMMNDARLHVGLQGLAIAERAYQQAVGYAFERKQGKAQGTPRTDSARIVEHPDVRRTLMLMRSQIEAMRCVVYRNAAAIDFSHHHPEEGRRAEETALAALLTPISKAWITDLGVEIASMGIQIHGGMGYIEETGAAQWWRDSRIAPIYEGTNGIQAIDLVARKLPMDGGGFVRDLLGRAAKSAESHPDEAVRTHLGSAVGATSAATDWLLERWPEGAQDALAGATPYLRMIGTTLGGWLLADSAVAAAEGNGYPEGFAAAKQATSHFFAEHVLSAVPGMLTAVTTGADTTFALDETALAR